MDTRLSFSKRVWLFSATTALLLSPTLDTMAQETTTKGSTRKNSSLKSAVQQELEAIYKRNGLEPPKLNSQDAIKRLERVNGKPNVKLVEKPEPTSPKTVSTKKPTFWSRLSLRGEKTETATKKPTPTRKQTVARSGRASSFKTSRRKPTSKPSNIKQASNSEEKKSTRNPRNFFTRIFPWSKKSNKSTTSKKPQVAKSVPSKSKKPSILPDRLKSQATAAAKPITAAATKVEDKVAQVEEKATQVEEKATQVADTTSIKLPAPEPLEAIESKPIPAENDPFTDVSEELANKLQNGEPAVAEKPIAKKEPALEEIPFVESEKADNPFSGKKLDEDAFLPPKKAATEIVESEKPAAKPTNDNPFAEVEKSLKPEEEKVVVESKPEPKSAPKLEFAPPKTAPAAIAEKPAPKTAPKPEFTEPKPAPAKSKPADIAKKPGPKPAQKKVASSHDAKMRLIAERVDRQGLKGFCPVTLRDQRDLKDGNKGFQSTYESKIYSFASTEAKATFDKNPAIYAPVMGGIDVTLLTQKGEKVAGSLDHAVWYKDRLYLFSSRRSMEDFVLAPADLAKK